MTPGDSPPRHLLLGVTGGIAAYKACDLVSRAVKAGWSVRVVMTPSATRFVGALTFEGLSGHPVMVDALATGAGADGASAIEHIAWARWASAVVIAPLTANTLAKLACGIADDALTTVCMALRPDVPVWLCPAMNTAMWDHPVVARNRAWIDALDRYRWIEPATKRLACGEYGSGGLADPADILAAVEAGRQG